MSTTTGGSAAAEQLQRNAIGVWDLVFFVGAAAAPLTVAAGIVPLAIGRGGIGAPGGYLIAGVLLLLFAVGFTRMSRHVRNAGAFYAYIGHGLGRVAGAGAATMAIFCYSTLNIGLYGAAGFFASTTFRDLFGIDLSWPVWAFAVLVLVAWLGFRQVTLSARLLAVALLAEIAILGVLAVAVLADGGHDGLSAHPLSPGTWFTGGTTSAVVLCFGAFVGFEATALYSEESRDSARAVTRATYVAVTFLTVFYVFISWMIIQAFGDAGALAIAGQDPAAMFFVATGDYVGTFAVDVMRVLIVTSALAALLASHNATARYAFALGREGVLPRVFGRAHRRTHAPWVAGFAQSAVAAVVVGVFAIAGADPFTQLLLWVNSPGIVGLMGLQGLCAVAVVGYYRRHPGLASAWAVAVAPTLAAAGMAAAVVLGTLKFDVLTGAGTTTNVLLLAPLPLCFAAGALRARHIRRHDPEAYKILTTYRVDDDTPPTSPLGPDGTAPSAPPLGLGATR